MRAGLRYGINTRKDSQGTMSDVCILPVAREMWIRCGRRSAIDMT